MLPTHPTHRYFLWLALLVIALALLGFGFGFGLLSRAPVETTSAPAGFPAEAPAPKPQDYVAAQKGFQYLVSYSDSGFHPVTLSVKRGETVRISNNSRMPVQLSLSGSKIASFGRAEYFEYLFTEAGSFTFSDGTNVIVVDAE